MERMFNAFTVCRIEIFHVRYNLHFTLKISFENECFTRGRYPLKMSVSLEAFVSIDHFLLSTTTIYKKWNRE